NYGCEIDGKIYSEAFRPGMNCDSLAERMSEFAGEKIRPSDLRLTLTLLDKKGYKVSMEGLSDLAVAPRTGLRVVKGEVLGKVADSLLEIAVTRDGRTISAIDYLNNTLSAATMTNPDTPISAAKVLTCGQMRDDIAALVEAYKECFPLWEEHVSSETIDKKVEEITASMPDTLSAYDTEAIMARMNALLHDSHIFYESVMAESEVWRPDIEFGLEGAKVIVTMASREKSEYLQAEVKEIDGLVADSIVRFARKYIGGYDLKVKDYVDNMLFGALTHIYCTYHPAKKSNKSFIITLASGKQVEGSARTGIHDKTIMMPDRTAFLSVNRHPGRKYAVEGVCDSIVYIGLSDFDLYETDVDSLVGVMTEPERYSAVIVDLRNNPGGSSEVADRMLEALCGDVFPWPDQCRIMSKQGGFEAFANSLNYAPDSPVAGPEYTLDSVSQLYINSRVGRMAIGANSGATRPRIILITNEGTGSAASYFASALRRAGRAEIIGREPRTAYHLITAVKECCLRLPNSGVVWHLPLVREVFDSDTAGVVPYGRGILPDVHIPLTYREVSFVDGDIMKGKAIGMASDSKGGGRSSMVGLVAVVAIVCGWLWRRRHKGAVR
ncbi:MAG: hypothetical protein J6C91_01405, partial [Muribaculaceae bacterium]|nr:hypothetical protein [Muribaculaceae bacterium]